MDIEVFCGQKDKWKQEKSLQPENIEVRYSARNPDPLLS
jgi:hypothetical protein